MVLGFDHRREFMIGIFFEKYRAASSLREVIETDAGGDDETEAEKRDEVCEVVDLYDVIVVGEEAE